MGKDELRCGGLEIDLVAGGDLLEALGPFHDLGWGLGVVVFGPGLCTFGEDAAIVGTADHNADIFFYA